MIPDFFETEGPLGSHGAMAHCSPLGAYPSRRGSDSSECWALVALLCGTAATACVASPVNTAGGAVPSPQNATRVVAESAAASLSHWGGTYTAGPFGVATVAAAAPYLAVTPPFWTSRPYLLPTGDAGEFHMALPHPRHGRTAVFRSGTHSGPDTLAFSGFEPWADERVFLRQAPGAAPTPGQLFFSGQPVEAANAALAWSPPLRAAVLEEFADRIVVRFPRRQADAAVFLAAVRAAHPDSAGLAVAHGTSLVATGRRDEARRAYERALALAPDNEDARFGLRMLDGVGERAKPGFRAMLPFHPAEAFRPPSAQELAAVRADWRGRDLGPLNAKVVHRYSEDYGFGPVSVSIVAHRVRGAIHYGAVLLPVAEGEPESPAARPVVVDARGVNPSYSPLDLREPPRSLMALGAAQTNYAFVVPAMPGHALIAGGKTFTSKGDAADAWDGATDATLALLGAALATSERLDPSRVAVVGHSRGGTVAMLAGIRDSRIDLVVSVAGPVDHFQAMQPFVGFTWAEFLVDAMADGDAPTSKDPAGQKYDHFFHRVPTEGETLADVRHRIAASSPLYFAADLPPTLAFFGDEDRSVPVANARALEQRFAELDRSEPDFRVHVYAGLGHDTEPLLVNRAIAEALGVALRAR